MGVAECHNSSSHAGGVTPSPPRHPLTQNALQRFLAGAADEAAGGAGAGGERGGGAARRGQRAGGRGVAAAFLQETACGQGVLPSPSPSPAPRAPVLTLRSLSAGPSSGSWVLGATGAMTGERKVCVGLRAGCRLTFPTCRRAPKSHLLALRGAGLPPQNSLFPLLLQSPPPNPAARGMWLAGGALPRPVALDAVRYCLKLYVFKGDGGKCVFTIRFLL